MYRIRIHGRGGQGIKMASRVLGTALFRCGFTVQDAPKYGAERRGAPIHATVRARRQAPGAVINERGLIHDPDLVVVADDTLVAVPAAGVLQGLGPDSVLLINTREDAATWRARLASDAQVLVLPVAQEAQDRAALPGVGATCAGAAACLLGVVEPQALAQAIEEELAPLGLAVVERNRRGALAAYRAMAAERGRVRERPRAGAADFEAPDWVSLPLDDPGIAAPAIRARANSVQLRTGLWRTLRPEIDYDRCGRCWWICSSLCPDSAINVEAGRPVIDYDHCKGCMICVGVCPPHAIASRPESSAQQDRGRAHAGDAAHR